METYDVGVVGGGIVGLATAVALLHDFPRVVVLEAESSCGTHQTGHNSGVIHSGLYYRPGSLKASLCTQGRELLYEFCAQRGIPHLRCGKVVVATHQSQVPRLHELARRGAANGLRGLRLLSGPEIREFEPHVTGVAGLYVPQTGVVDFRQVAETLARDLEARGGEVKTRASVYACVPDGDALVAETTSGPYRCRTLVNCAGLQADRVARRCGVRPPVAIIPFRGEYYHVVPSRAHLVRHLIYPVPDPRFPFLGVHFTRTVHGTVEAGPNAVLALSRHGYRKTDVSLRDVASLVSFPGFWLMAKRYWVTGIAELGRSWCKRAFVRALQRLVPEIRGADLVPGESGVRAQAVSPRGDLLDDFCIVETVRMVHVLNAPSPAATASLAIGRHIAEVAKRQFS